MSQEYFEARLENMEFALDERLIEFWRRGINAKPTIEKSLKGPQDRADTFIRGAKSRKLRDLRKKSDEWKKYSKSGKGTHDMKTAAEKRAEAFRKAAREQRG